VDNAQILIAKCANSFVNFLKEVKIIEPPTIENPGGTIPFQMWDHTKEAIAVLLSERLIVWGKSRQIGASWLVAAYVLWYALFHYGASILLVSKGEKEAFELLEKCRRILKSLPVELYSKPNPDASSEMGFPNMSSSIKALPATAEAGVSFTASIIVCDEWDIQEYAAQNYAQIKPCIDSCGGQFIGIFTRNPWGSDDSLPLRTFREALQGKNGFFPIFHPYNVRPGRDEKWYEKVKMEISEDDLAGLTRDIYMWRNYPKSIDEFFATIKTLQVFDHKILDEMMGETRNPIMIDNVNNSIIHVYKPFCVGEQYISAIDTAHGVGKDYSVCVILNVRTGEVVADICDNHLSDDMFAWNCNELLKVYGCPLCFPEDNDWGKAVINNLQLLGYKNFGYQDVNKTKPGFHTDKKTRNLLWNAVMTGINNRQIKIYSKQGLKQFYDVIKGADGTIQTKPGGNDDYPVSVGIAWLKRREVQMEEWRPYSVETLAF
jgi:hypothetical protein